MMVPSICARAAFAAAVGSGPAVCVNAAAGSRTARRTAGRMACLIPGVSQRWRWLHAGEDPAGEFEKALLADRLLREERVNE